MFLEVPPPPVYAHPVKLRRVSHAPRLPTRKRAPSRFMSTNCQLKTAGTVARWHSKRSTLDVNIMQQLGSSVFNDDFDRVFSLHRADGSLPSSISLDSVLPPASAALGTDEQPTRRRRTRFKRMSLSGAGRRTGSGLLMQRNATWDTRGRSFDGNFGEDDLDGDLRNVNVQPSFVSHLVPGSLAMHSFSRCAFCRQQSDQGNGLPMALTRTKSQPTLAKDDGNPSKEGLVRRIASLHSIRDMQRGSIGTGV
jgi:hypothetical protein